MGNTSVGTVRIRAVLVAIGLGSSSTSAQSDCQPSLVQRVTAVNLECCNDKTEDCSSGAPAICDAGCAAVFLPFWHDCEALVGSDWARSAAISGIVTKCEAAAGQESDSGAAAANSQCSAPYETLGDQWRLSTEPGGMHCDRSPVYGYKDTVWFSPGSRWFRISGEADALPTTPPGFQQCGTQTGGWLSGWDNSQGDPPVSATPSATLLWSYVFMLAYQQYCAGFSLTILVRSCTNRMITIRQATTHLSSRGRYPASFALTRQVWFWKRSTTTQAPVTGQ